jgi:uncharacterized protein (UPF0548 family)
MRGVGGKILTLLILRMRLLTTEEKMKRQWRLCRTTLERKDATQRWDRAYQSILLWSLRTQQILKAQENQEEVYHAHSSLRQGLDLSTGQAPDD